MTFNAMCNTFSLRYVVEEPAEAWASSLSSPERDGLGVPRCCGAHSFYDFFDVVVGPDALLIGTTRARRQPSCVSTAQNGAWLSKCRVAQVLQRIKLGRKLPGVLAVYVHFDGLGLPFQRRFTHPAGGPGAVQPLPAIQPCFTSMKTGEAVHGLQCSILTVLQICANLKQKQAYS